MHFILSAPRLASFWGLNRALNRGSFRGYLEAPSEGMMKGYLDASTAVAHVDGMRPCFTSPVRAPDGVPKGVPQGAHLGYYLGTLFGVPNRPKWRFGTLKRVLNR